MRCGPSPSSRVRARLLGSVAAALTLLGVVPRAHAGLADRLPDLNFALPRLTLDLEWSGLHVTEVVESVAGSIRGCLTEAGLLGSFWNGIDPSRPDVACASNGSLVLDVAFLALLVIAVIGVVRIRQRTEQNRLELARQYIEKGMNPPPSLFPSAAGNDLRRGIVLVFTGLGLLCASLVASGWSHGVQGLGPAGLIPGFIGLGYLVSYACAVRWKKIP